MFESDAVEKFHCDERMSILLADIVDHADIRVIQSRCSLSLPLETGQCLEVATDLVRQEFEGNKTVQPCVLSFINDTHATAAQFFDNPIVRYGLADHGRSLCG